MQKSRTHFTIINTTIGIINRIVLLLANFVIRTVFIRYLGIEYTGVSSVFSDILSILALSELGIGSAITYALYKPIADGDNRQIAKLMRLYKRAYIIISLFILIVGILLIPFITILVPNTPEITEDIRLIFFLYILNTALSYLFIYKSVLLTASQRNYYISYVNIIVCALKTVVQVVIIIYFKLFILYLVTEILFSLINNIVIREVATRLYFNLSYYSHEKLSNIEIKSIFNNIKALSLYKVSGAVLLGSNGVIISYFYGVGVVGYISNYILIIQQLYAFALQFFNSITSSIGNLVVSEDSEKQICIFERAFFLTSFFFCISSVILFNSLSIFIGGVWLDSNYIIPLNIVAFLCIDFYLKGIASIVNSFRNANGLFIQGQYRPVIMVVLNLIFAIIGIQLVGVPGVFIGTVLARVMTQTWFDPYILYRYAFKLRSFLFFKHLLLWFVVTALSAILSMIVCEYTHFENCFVQFLFNIFISSIITIFIICVFFVRDNNFLVLRCFLLNKVSSIMNR